jgi:cation diffusion facilitator CzcD-associated flavoprotein CzcO
MANQPHVVILGAGFGGIGALKSLGDADVSVTLIDLGLDHFEGRSWRGFHHHLALSALAYLFILTIP